MMQSAGLELPDKGSVAVRAERMAGTEAVASQSLAYDDPQVGITHLTRA